MPRSASVRTLALVAVLTVGSLGSPLLVGGSWARPASTITEFPLASGTDPYAITTGLDGNLWFTEYGTGKIGRITPSGTVTEFPLASATSEPSGIATNTVGRKVWFTESAANKIGSISTRSPYAVQEYTLPTANSFPTDIVAGPDGNLWFTEFNTGKIGRITTAGSITEFPVPTTNSGLYGIGVGPDGSVWFTEDNANQIGRILVLSPYTVTEFPIPSSSSYPTDIVGGTDGNLWFTEEGLPGRVGRILAASPNTITEFPTPTPNSGPFGIAAGPDGDLWFAEAYTDDIGQMTTSGSFVGEFPTLTLDSSPYGITEGPDAAMWFAEFGANKIGRATDVPVPAITLQPTSGHPGILVNVAGSGYGSFEKVQLVFKDSVNGLTVLGTAFADATGDFGATVHVPSNATLGNQAIGAKGPVSKVLKKATFKVT
jgi:streptogramin lyase